MESPKKLVILQKDSNFLIRRTLRPPSAIRNRARDSPSRKTNEGRRSSMLDHFTLTRSLAPSSLGTSAVTQD
jgi:hypothetical protein